MEIDTSKSGRVVVEIDGYSDSYRAYIQGALTGKVSFPARFSGEDNDVLARMAMDCLQDKKYGTANTAYYGAKIIRAAGKIE